MTRSERRRIWLALIALGFGVISEPLGLFGAEIAPRLNTIGEKPFGLLLLGEGGDRDWKAAVDDARAHAAGKYPLEFASGEADRREMQRGIDALQAQRVRTIVIVPLLVSSYGEVMDQTRYLLGIREKPSNELLDAPHEHTGGLQLQRLKSRVPLVLTKALDDHPLFVELLAARAQALSRRPANEALVLVGAAPAAKDDQREWNETVSALAEKVRQKGGFASARAYALRTDGRQEDRDLSAQGLGSMIRDVRRSHNAVIIVPLALTNEDTQAMRLRPALEGMFVRYDGRTVLPDPRISAWIEQTALPAAKLPDMRLFKDSAKAGLLPQGLTHQPIAPPPALPKPGEKQNQ